MISTKRANRIQRLFLLLLCVLSLLLTSCDVGDWLSRSNAPPVQSDGELNVHFLDVGQGDSALLMTGNGSTILIDAGTNASQDEGYIVQRKGELLVYLFRTMHQGHTRGTDAHLPAHVHVTGTFLPASW